LATTEAVESLSIRWPGGHTEHFHTLPINTTIEFVEGEPTWTDVYARARAAKG